LLNIPVGLYTAEKRVDLHFRMIDSRSKKPIRYERVNAETGEEVPWKDIVQAFEYEKGNYVVLSEDEMAAVAPKGKESIELEEFVDRLSIPPLFYEKPYYLVPGKKAEKGYVLLREILRKSGRVGIGHVMIRTRRYLSAVLVEDDALILNLLRFRQELVPMTNFTFPPADFDALRIAPRELTMATQLIDSMTVDWAPERYVDDYRERLTELVDKHLANKSGLVHEEEGGDHAPENAATNVVDFMALLKDSLKKKEKSGESNSGSAKKSATKRVAAKGSAVKDSAAKGAAKGSAEKSSAKKSTKKSAVKSR
jgi:DNA end-binding protein Ku